MREMEEDEMAISREAAGVFDGQNLSLYSYVGNNPLIYIDPNGLWRAKNESVKIDDLSENVKKIEKIVDRIFEETGATNNPAITSGTEKTKKHAPNSKHYTKEAIDLEIWGLKKDPNDVTKDDVQKTVDALKKALGDDYDVINEWDAKGGPHIHIEYDPKKGPKKPQDGNYGFFRENQKNQAASRNNTHEGY